MTLLLTIFIWNISWLLSGFEPRTRACSSPSAASRSVKMTCALWHLAQHAKLEKIWSRGSKLCIHRGKKSHVLKHSGSQFGLKETRLLKKKFKKGLSASCFIVKILNLYIILVCTHFYHTSFRYLSITSNPFIACYIRHKKYRINQ